MQKLKQPLLAKYSMNLGRLKLREVIYQQGKEPEYRFRRDAFCRRINASSSTLNRYLNGNRQPSITKMSHIMDVLDGLITPNDWATIITDADRPDLIISEFKERFIGKVLSNKIQLR